LRQRFHHPVINSQRNCVGDERRLRGLAHVLAAVASSAAFVKARIQLA